MSGTVMITTGGTGGHVFPGLAVAAELIARDWRVFWLGTRDGMEARIVPRHKIEFEGLSFAGVRGKGLVRLLLAPYAILYACWQARRVIRSNGPTPPGASRAVVRSCKLLLECLKNREYRS